MCMFSALRNVACVSATLRFSLSVYAKRASMSNASYVVDEACYILSLYLSPCFSEVVIKVAHSSLEYSNFLLDSCVKENILEVRVDNNLYSFARIIERS